MPDQSHRHSIRLFRVFSSGADAQRIRRPTDVILLIVSVLVLLVLLTVAPGPTAVDSALMSLTVALETWFAWFWDISYALLLAWALVLIVAALAARGRRHLLLDYLAGAGTALAVCAGLGLLAGATLSELLDALITAGPPTAFPAVRVAVITAVVVTASPHMSRPLRYVGRVILLLGAIASVAIGIAVPIGAIAGVAAGVASAAVIHLLLGSPGGRPTVRDVERALTDLDIEASDVQETEVSLSGFALFRATDAEGNRLSVKVYGRDSWDGQVLTSTWTALQTRGETPRIAGRRFEQVEHEAVATLIAERAGVPVEPIAAVGRSADGDALLVTRTSGTALADIDPPSLQDATLASAWRALGALHDLGVSHGHLDSRHVMVRPDGTAALADLGAARLADSQTGLMTDRAQLLVAGALAAGSDRSVAAALSVLGAEGLADVLPLLQPAVLDRTTRAAVKASAWELDDLRAAAAAAAEVETPELLRIRRVTGKSVLMIALIALITYFLITQLSGVDFEAVWQELSSADVAWLLLALLISPIVQMSYSFGTLGASMVALRYFPVLMLQYAIQFIALVLPATAARLALEIRFFERFGIPAGAALSIGLVDSVSGFVVQIALILLILLSGVPGVSSSEGTSSSTTTTTTTSDDPSLLMLAIGIGILAVLVTLIVPRFRHRLRDAIPKWRTTLREQAVAARSSLTVLRHPSKVGLMLGGNLGAQVLQALILGICLKAFGSEAELSQLILINTAVSLFAGLMPVPGGMGVAEAGYTAGLTAIGVPSTIAISTAIAFRLVTFYLPPLWGSVAMRWLRRNSYV